MPPVTRAAKARHEALAKENNKPAAKRKASQKKAEKGPLVQEAPAKNNAVGKAAQSAGTEASAGGVKTKKTGGNAMKKSAQPHALTASTPAAAPVKARGKRGLDDTEQQGKDSTAPTQGASHKRARWTATSTEAEVSPRWAEKSEDDDEDDEDKEDSDD
ncbi:hypothetical protein PspLS_04092 [Pyricularia sp. CBS 133598]|nr:hypothetical protein PspLS_04092 [Pyricularia sp. CBS 133598]